MTNIIAPTTKTFNFYCDESCHLENDGMPFMIISYISSAYNQTKLHTDFIKQLRKRHNFYNEIKWSSLSKAKYPFYSELIDYFFATDLQFRAIVIDKSQIKHEAFNQTHDDFYYKMYYHLLSKKISPKYNYNIYLDIKDTLSASKVNGLCNYLNHNYVAVRKVQNIRSDESQLMQLTDVLMGAISYFLRGQEKVIAKKNIVDKIKAHSKHPLNHSSSILDNKFNLFFIDLE